MGRRSSQIGDDEEGESLNLRANNHFTVSKEKVSQIDAVKSSIRFYLWVEVGLVNFNLILYKMLLLIHFLILYSLLLVPNCADI